LIIDAHAHIYPAKIAVKATAAVGSFYDLPMRHTGGTAQLLDSGKQAGVDRFVVCSVATSPEQVAIIDRFLAEECRLHPELIGLGSLHPASPDFAADVALLQACGFRGAKLHPDFQAFHIDDPAVYPLYDLLQSEGIPLLLHTGDPRKAFSRPERLQKVLAAFPRLCVVAAHFGGWSIWEDAFAALRSAHCYVDTCSSLQMMEPTQALRLIRGYGAERVLFGVDFPMWDHGDELRALERLGLTDAETELLLHKNAERVFGGGDPS
jgi:predicted TIM-barrel fold metal-dependent hydrolase